MEVIKILNWEKFNPRKDRVRHHWFRVDNDIPFSKTLFGFEPDQKWLWICLLALASKSGKNEIELNEKYLAAHTGLKPSRLRQTIEAFKQHSMISITSPLGNQSGTNGVLHNNTLHNVHNNTNSTDITSSTVAEAAPAVIEIDRSELVSFENEKTLIDSIPEATKQRWATLYPDKEFLLREVLKAFNWYENNPIKKPKKLRGWISALSSWFERGWPKHLKTIESKKAVGFSENEMTAILEGKI